MCIVTWPFIMAVVSFVSDQAEITAHPQNKTRIEGENVTISCNADGNPVPTISWTRNGSPLDTSNNSRISFSEGKKQLNITNVSRTDSGEYQCVASNSLGNDASNAATLDVQCKDLNMLNFIPSYLLKAGVHLKPVFPPLNLV